MADMPPPSSDQDEAGASVNDMTPEEVNRIIHSHRKVRYGEQTPLLFPALW